MPDKRTISSVNLQTYLTSKINKNNTIFVAFMPVVEPDRSCVVSVTSSPLHIAAAAAAGVSQSTQSNVIGCGTKTQPWILEAPAGQRINISLLDFTAAAARLTSQHLTRSTSRVITTSSSSSSGSCVDENQQYGYIIDESSVNNKNVSVCHARSNRLTHLYLSASNTLQLVLANDNRANFLIRVGGLDTFYVVGLYINFI